MAIDDSLAARISRARVRPGKYGAAALAGALVMIYVVGLCQDTWMVVHRQGKTSAVIANIGVFSACGYDSNLQVVFPKVNRLSWLTQGKPTKTCSSLLNTDVPAWFRSVQVLSIVCVCLLTVSWGLFAYIMCCSDLENKPARIALIIVWVTTSVMLLIHPIIFASHMRPGRQVKEFPKEEDHPVPDMYENRVEINTMYLGAFVLHCIVAGAANLINLVVLCCVCVNLNR